MTAQHHKLLILGSGPAGCTAAIYAARAGLEPALLSGMQPGGQLTITTDVENYPGYADPVQGPWMMEQMQKQAENCGTKFIYDQINEVELSKPPFTLKGDGGTYTCDSLIICTGASAKWLGIPSEQSLQGKGVSACATCDGPFFRNADVVVVGGGNSAMEEALFLATICNKVTMIHRRDEFRGERVLRERVAKNEKIDVLWDSELDEILADESKGGVVCAARVKNRNTGEMTEVPAEGVFIAIGHKPNTDIFKGILPMDEYGYLTVPKGTVSTEIPGVFAAGDVIDKTYRQAVTAAGLGCMAALDAVRYFEGLEAEENSTAA